MFAMKVVCAVFICLMMTTWCEGNPELKESSPHLSIDNTVQDRNHLEESLVRKMNTKCSQNDVSSCVMLKLVTYMNRMLKKTVIQVGNDLEITSNGAAVDTPVNSSKTPDAPRASELSEDDQMTDLLLQKAWTFIKTRSLRWKVVDGAEIVVASTRDDDGEMKLDVSLKSQVGESGRGKSKHLGPLLAAAAMKIGLLGGLAFKGLVLLVGKALLVAKIALLLASIIGLKKLFSGQKHVTYEVVAHPHHSHEPSGHEEYPGFGRQIGRADQSAHEMAYWGQLAEKKSSLKGKNDAVEESNKKPLDIKLSV